MSIMIFSRSDEYAIRAMTFLAMQPAGKLAGARKISEAERIPMQFLWKILQNLAKRRLIRSFKGLRGGYELAQPASEVTLSRILGATAGADRLGGCLLGLPQCSDGNPCPMHEKWKVLRSSLAEMIEQSTLADLVRAAQNRAASPE
jgi:Rrf2 family transcriptional regulator, iron-sulfur cluster assembly transcription factor